MKRVLLLVAFACLASLGCQTHYATLGQHRLPELRTRWRARAICRWSRRTELSGLCTANPTSLLQTGATGRATDGAIAYPYYTTRGPRDFFLDNPVDDRLLSGPWTRHVGLA